MIAACQFVYEEKFIAKYNIHPLKVVGSEGIFGFFTLLIVQVRRAEHSPLCFVVNHSKFSFEMCRSSCISWETSDFNLVITLMGDLKIHLVSDNVCNLHWINICHFLDAFTQMNNSPELYGFLSLIIVSIAFFNFSGVSITKYMGATTRKVLDTLRTLVIWICSMMLHFYDERWDMPSFKHQFWLQLAGFFFVVTGIFLYSDLLIMPYIRERRKQKEENKISNSS